MRVEEMEKKMQKCAEDPKERMTTPQADGFFMPGEYEPHDGCILIWPSRPGSWIYGARDARIAFRDVIAAIAQSENVYVAAGRDCMHPGRLTMRLQRRLPQSTAMRVTMPRRLYWRADRFTATVRGRFW